jgi:flagellar biosynthesis/type III secretory pathway protein FliH
MAHIKKFNEDINFIKAEERTIKQISDLIERAYYKGFVHGLKKGGLNGEFKLDNLEMNLNQPGINSIQDVNNYLSELSEEAKKRIMNLSDLK